MQRLIVSPLDEDLAEPRRVWNNLRDRQVSWADQLKWAVHSAPSALRILNFFRHICLKMSNSV